VIEYPYKRAARHAWTVAQWGSARFAPHYPGFGVEVLNPDRGTVPVSIDLGTVRHFYAEARGRLAEPFPIPGPEAPISEILDFALTFSAYERLNAFGTEPVATIANRARERWVETQETPTDLTILRTALFFEQRRCHWGNSPGPEDGRYYRALVSAIRAVAGDELPGPRDWGP
jgi:hypothetical protein